jgi:DNA-binding MarR family transcriptional regulator
VQRDCWTDVQTQRCAYFTIVVDTTILKRYIETMSKIKASRHSTLQDELGESQPFQVPEQEAYLNLVRTHALLSNEVAELFKQHHLSQPLYNVLKVVARVGSAGMPSQSIAQYMVARDPDITRLVDRLQKDRLIERERDEQDRRVVYVKVTQSGLDVIQKLDPLIWKLHRQQLGHLSEDKLELLNQLLVEARLNP